MAMLMRGRLFRVLQGLDWGCIKCFASTGEASSAEDSHWLTAQAGYKPVIEICGGTELGGAFLGGSMLQPQAPASFSIPSIGDGAWLCAD